MRITHSLSILLALAGTPSVYAEAAPPTTAPASAPSGTVYAVRKVELARQAKHVRLSELIAEAVRKHADIIGITPDRALGITGIQQRVGIGEFEIVVRFDPKRDRAAIRRADEFVDQVLETLEAELRKRQAGVAEKEELAKKVADAESKANIFSRQLLEIELAIRAKTGRADASAEALRIAVPKIDDERQALRLQVIGKQARQEALVRTIERVTKQAVERAQEDPVAAELEKVVRIKELARERINKLRENNAVSDMEAAEAEGPIAEAKARLFERREAVKQANGGELMSTLNRDLATLSIDLAEIEAKLAETEKLLQQYDDVPQLLNKADEIRRDRERAERELDASKTKLDDLNDQLPAKLLRVTRSESATPDRLGWEPDAPQANP